MRLLILLSALIAGMTGFIAGGPASAHASGPAAIAAALSDHAEQGQEAAEIRPVLATGYDLAAVLGDWRINASARQPQLHPVDERRIV